MSNYYITKDEAKELQKSGKCYEYLETMKEEKFESKYDDNFLYLPVLFTSQNGYSIKYLIINKNVILEAINHWTSMENNSPENQLKDLISSLNSSIDKPSSLQKEKPNLYEYFENVKETSDHE